MNARNFLYIRKYNKGKARGIADNKLATKQILLKYNIPTSSLLKAFVDRKSIRNFDWNLPQDGFAVKPARGYMGEGILVFRSWNGEEGETLSGEHYDVKRLESHIMDIFDGVYSLQSLPDQAYIEEKIYPHPFFKKIVPIGLPDIRLIVFQKVPVMAMVRLPTSESRGKANLHLGAIGVGVDLRTGITTHAIKDDKPLEFIPETKTKTRGIKLPLWDQILETSIRTQEASRLGYAGVDLVLDADNQVKVLEVNARPGLSIQIANLASLRPRLERVAGLQVNSVERGVEIAKNLFAEQFAEKVAIGPKILGFIESISVKTPTGEIEVDAKIDSGAFRTSLDQALVQEWGLQFVNKKIFVKAASGQGYRDAVKFDFVLKGKKVSTIATVAERSHLRYPVIVGRRDMKGFLIDPSIGHEEEDLEDEIRE